MRGDWLYLVFLYSFLMPSINCDYFTFQKGMSLFPVGDSPYGSNSNYQSLQNMKSTNIEWISLVFTWNQQTINSTTLFPSQGFSEAGLNTTIQQAHSLGFKIMLKPHIDPLDGIWRAWIGYYFNTTQWNLWFESYLSFIIHFAALSSDLGIEQFCSGVEYISASAQEAQWRNIIYQIRQVYNGTVTYAANWGNLYEILPPNKDIINENVQAGGGEINWIQWFDVLDIIGCDAYYPLSSEVFPSLAAVEQGWAPNVPHLANISSFWNKNIIFTEIGYRSIDGAAIHPAWWNITAPVNETQQYICYQATFNSFIYSNWWQGIFWWSWSTDPNCGGPTDIGFSPQNKITQDLIHAVYEKMN